MTRYYLANAMESGMKTKVMVSGLLT